MRGPKLPDLLAQLLGPRLDGAVCAGRSAEWDADPWEAGDARVHYAVATCHRCPVRVACAEAATELGELACGIWGGQLLDRGRVIPLTNSDPHAQ